MAIATRGIKHIDLRRGAFQYKASYSIVREKATHLALLAAAVVASVGIHATMSLRRLSAEREGLRTQLAVATKELFGAARMEATDVIAALKRSHKDEMVSLPKATAYDLLDEISRRLPAADKVKLDIEDFDIRSKKASIKGTVDSAAAVDEMVIGRHEHQTRVGDDAAEDAGVHGEIVLLEWRKWSGDPRSQLGESKDLKGGVHLRR